MSDPAPSTPNPCLSCGACCAHFRVSFYWAEAEATGMPEAFTEQVNERFSCMRGTNGKEPRCVALQGEIGREVGCSVYELRTSPCRELQAGDEKCNRARARHGLAPISADRLMPE